MRRFTGIDLISDRIPDETMILTFRHLLEKHGLGEQIFASVKAHLSARGMTMRQGTIVDATLIAAPSSTKNSEGKRDPEMHQTKKGNLFGATPQPDCRRTPGHQAAVRISKDPAVRDGQESLQGQRDRSAHKSVLGVATAG
jgi:hypothetical protein